MHGVNLTEAFTAGCVYAKFIALNSSFTSQPYLFSK
jgi:hypothetical protein